jgi:hypothetical protein
MNPVTGTFAPLSAWDVYWILYAAITFGMSRMVELIGGNFKRSLGMEVEKLYAVA